MLQKIMLEQADQKRPLPHFGARLLIVSGQRFANSAAKFWTSLMDELLAEPAGCQKAALEAVNDRRLDPALLFPEISLERELNLRSDNIEDFSAVWRQALADFELYGPPGSVTLRIFFPAGAQKRLALPLDCVDAELFPYLLAWLLEWGELPPSGWNEPKVAGSFAAFDPFRQFRYAVNFALEQAPLKEGLLTWRVELEFDRRAALAGKQN